MRWLLDEMLPAAACAKLTALGHDATSVRAQSLSGADDERVFDLAVEQSRIIVTENFADYSLLLEQCMARAAPCVPVVFVRKADLPRRGALATILARRLHAWALANPEPYLGPHWA